MALQLRSGQGQAHPELLEQPQLPQHGSLRTRVCISKHLRNDMEIVPSLCQNVQTPLWLKGHDLDLRARTAMTRLLVWRPRAQSSYPIMNSQ